MALEPVGNGLEQDSVFSSRLHGHFEQAVALLASNAQIGPKIDLRGMGLYVAGRIQSPEFASEFDAKLFEIIRLLRGALEQEHRRKEEWSHHSGESSRGAEKSGYLVNPHWRLEIRKIVESPIL
jgi:hypothetical protein